MKKLSWLIGLVAVVGAYWGCSFEEYSPPPVDSALVTLEINSPALKNNFIGDPAVREVTVYVPYDYLHRSEKRSYPVAYLLHGIPFGERAYADPAGWGGLTGGMFKKSADFPAQGFKAWIDGLINSGEIEDMIIVMPDATSKYGASFYTNSEVNGNYENYIAEDVVSLIDNTYNTIAAPDGRAILGVSQGGYGAIMIAMTQPGVFGTVGAHSAILDLDWLKRFIVFVMLENPDGMHGPRPGKEVTKFMYAMSAAWTPNPDNPPYFVDLLFDYPSPLVKEEVWARWLEHDPTMLLQQTQYQNNLRALNRLYIDVGRWDEMQLYMPTEVFHQRLEQLQIQHQYEMHMGTHFSDTYDRIKASLKVFSESLREGGA